MSTPAGIMTFCCALSVAWPAAAANGASSEIETDGGTIRLMVAATADGTLRGALEFDLAPGWKTYWRDPGASGIPPTLKASENDKNGFEVSIHYPAPEWVEAPYGDWIGYSEPVVLPLTFDGPDLPETGEIKVWMFAGICAEVCIPVSGEMTAAYSLLTSDFRDSATIEAAFAALPGAPDDALRVASVTPAGDGSLLIAIEGEESAGVTNGVYVHAAELSDGRIISMKKPERVETGASAATFRVEPARPATDPRDITVHVTIAGETRAVAADFQTVIGPNSGQ